MFYEEKDVYNSYTTFSVVPSEKRISNYNAYHIFYTMKLSL